ncbi:hypothetical protein MASR1M59_25540 [Melaminivora sp.]
MPRFALPLLTALALAAGGAGAQTVYGQLGTTGATLGYAQHLGSYNLRGDVNFASYDRNFRAGSVDYGAKLKLTTVGLFADFFPIGQFRVTAGAFLGKDKISAYGENSATSDVLPGEYVEGRIRSRNLRPYLGVGWGFGPQAGTGLSFAVDLGASYGALRTEYDVSPGMQRYWGNDRLQQERRKFDDKVDDYKWFPVVRIGASYRF